MGRGLGCYLHGGVFSSVVLDQSWVSLARMRLSSAHLGILFQSVARSLTLVQLRALEEGEGGRFTHYTRTHTLTCKHI